VGCLGGITGYVQVPDVLELVGSGHATAEYGNSPIDSWYHLWYMISKAEGFVRGVRTRVDGSGYVVHTPN
jgi:hypothetical protein